MVQETSRSETGGNYLQTGRRIAMTLILSVLTLSTSAAATGAGGDNPITNFVDVFADMALPTIMAILFLMAVLAFALSTLPFGPQTKNNLKNTAKGCLLGVIGVPLLVLIIPIILDMIPMDVGDVNPFAGALIALGAI